MHVKDLMQTDIATLRTNDSLDVAEDIMGMGRFRHLPVVPGRRPAGRYRLTTRPAGGRRCRPC